MLSLDRDYRSILDLGAPSEVANRLFFRLLDGRIMLAVVRAAAAVFGGNPTDLARVELRRRKQIDGTDEAANRLGGVSGTGIIEASLSTERQILGMLDSLLPVDWQSGFLGTPTSTHFVCFRMLRLSSMVCQSYETIDSSG